MGTDIRPEISKKSPYWIDRHRYYELKHFCLQYELWKKKRALIDGMGKSNPRTESIKSGYISDPTEKMVEMREQYTRCIQMIEDAARGTDEQLSYYILYAVTHGVSYEYMRVNFNIPCCKDSYYDLYRKFFWLLSEARG